MMPRTVAIGVQSFEDIRENGYFYVDKTEFIREWWERGDSVTLIARPRRFGKTLNMSMLECFFSNRYAGRGDLFEGLSVWEDGKYRELQGTCPVIALSFANVKEDSYAKCIRQFGDVIADLYENNRFLLESGTLSEEEERYFRSVLSETDEMAMKAALHNLSKFLSRYYGKKAIILLDEYDTPMQEAYVGGFWNEIVPFMRNLFHATFKTNPYMARAVMTGITRISKESIFSDMNNLKVVTTMAGGYETAFGFTEGEVFAALDEQGMPERKGEVKRWYDGFTFGDVRDIYNPWSITSFLDEKRLGTYWANTSSNGLVSKLIREGTPEVKTAMEDLLEGKLLCARIDEQIVFSDLDGNADAIWSLLLASGYLKVEEHSFDAEDGTWEYGLALTNFETKVMFRQMISRWFSGGASRYNDFVKAFLTDDLEAMNEYMNRVALATFSSFDAGNAPSERTEPERFFHGFVLGLMVDLRQDYEVKSNRESGFGRYDVMLKPKRPELDGMVLEFKVRNARREESLEETVAAALRQIEEKRYDVELAEAGIERIRHYGFAFEGKRVLIGAGKRCGTLRCKAEPCA